MPATDKAAEWSCDEVEKWLTAIGAARYRQRFRRKKINGAKLLKMTEPMLVQLGISEAIPRKRLHMEIEVLRDFVENPQVRFYIQM